ncbi:hypothetical protein A1O3_06560 [Capronia epimyces CBS 606.96]|uniref:Uncharacterized protein n=1 Tax=Capronia epimyces CBS 606.96 TaxID=1182542 RepID=W9XZD0_9EURO|nr:uncharacterized protein A1O3_06560 [Capronia epimyces CBS 606.96]EXJ82745.1 hypothetical protein A1O3_06560 [Capronia epimyces CBS 606.96]
MKLFVFLVQFASILVPFASLNLLLHTMTFLYFLKFLASATAEYQPARMVLELPDGIKTIRLLLCRLIMFTLKIYLSLWLHEKAREYDFAGRNTYAFERLGLAVRNSASEVHHPGRATPFSDAIVLSQHITDLEENNNDNDNFSEFEGARTPSPTMAKSGQIPDVFSSVVHWVTPADETNNTSLLGDRRDEECISSVISVPAGSGWNDGSESGLCNTTCIRRFLEELVLLILSILLEIVSHDAYSRDRQAFTVYEDQVNMHMSKIVEELGNCLFDDAVDEGEKGFYWDWDQEQGKDADQDDDEDDGYFADDEGEEEDDIKNAPRKRKVQNKVDEWRTKNAQPRQQQETAVPDPDADAAYNRDSPLGRSSDGIVLYFQNLITRDRLKSTGEDMIASQEEGRKGKEERCSMDIKHETATNTGIINDDDNDDGDGDDDGEDKFATVEDDKVANVMDDNLSTAEDDTCESDSEVDVQVGIDPLSLARWLAALPDPKPQRLECGCRCRCRHRRNAWDWTNM